MAKNRTKKKRRYISFLVVPDDYSEPLRLKLSVITIRIISIVGIVLFLHIIVGGLFYYRYYVVHKENNLLKKEKTRLESENMRINTISEKTKEVDSFLRKLKVSLGIEAGTASDQVSAKHIDQIMERDTKISRDYEPIPLFDTKDIANQNVPFQYVKNEKSTFHSLFENYPTYLPVEGIITLGFDSSVNHEPLSRDQHLGIDIAAKRGTVIKAAGAGNIVFSGWTPNLGYLIILYHGDGIFTYYAHNMRILRQRGFVKKAEPVALLGSSGKSSSGPHLHFEIWKDGKPINPEEYIFALQFKNAQKGL